MFSCIKKQSHYGEVVNILCLEDTCHASQLCCINCKQEDHLSHRTTSLRTLLPELLTARQDRDRYQSHLQLLSNFLQREFPSNSPEVTVQTAAAVAVSALGALKGRLEANKQQLQKMQRIMHSLNPNASTSPGRAAFNGRQGEYRGREGTALGVRDVCFQTFSPSCKHPYLNMSADMKTVEKTSHTGHRFAAVGAKLFSAGQDELRVRIDRSASGHILLGLCHEEVVRENEFTDCYGTGQGAYLIGQNANSPSAISFHHSVGVFNRKEIVGWNFKVDDVVAIRYDFKQSTIHFRKEEKGKEFSFAMRLGQKAEGEKRLARKGEALELKLVVLLQKEGDKVSLLD